MEKSRVAELRELAENFGEVYPELQFFEWIEHFIRLDITWGKYSWSKDYIEQSLTLGPLPGVTYPVTVQSSNCGIIYNSGSSAVTDLDKVGFFGLEYARQLEKQFLKHRPALAQHVLAAAMADKIVQYSDRLPQDTLALSLRDTVQWVCQSEQDASNAINEFITAELPHVLMEIVSRNADLDLAIQYAIAPLRDGVGSFKPEWLLGAFDAFE
jgi:hypothetical protein